VRVCVCVREMLSVCVSVFECACVYIKIGCEAGVVIRNSMKVHDITVNVTTGKYLMFVCVCVCERETLRDCV